MTHNGKRYWERRKKGLCVSCGAEASKSRCPSCMSDLTFAVKKSSRARIRRLEERIKELEGAGKCNTQNARLANTGTG